MIRTITEIICDGGCGTRSETTDTLQPMRTLSDVGWSFPVTKSAPDAEPEQKHYCPVCTRARLVGTV